MTTSILIVEDVEPTRLWLADIARDVADDVPVHMACSLAEARAWLVVQDAKSSPLCLIDLGLPDGSGVDFIRDLLARVPMAEAVVTTLYDDDAHLLAAMAAGAHGYLLKDSEPAELVRRLCAMQQGDMPISPAVASRILAHFRERARFMVAGGEATSLSPRETDVLRMIGRGLKVSEAASALGLSQSTVAGYLKVIYRKLDIGTRAEAATEAMRRGLI